MNNDCNKIWNSCLSIIKDNVPSQTYNTWFAPIVPLNYIDDVFSVKVPSSFFVEFLEERFLDLIKRSLCKSANSPTLRLEYKVSIDNAIGAENPTFPSSGGNKMQSSSLDMNGGLIHNPFSVSNIRNTNIDPQLNPNYSFENFVAGSCNNLIYSAGLDIAKNPGNSLFNPLFIHGGSGLGKTHIAQAIGLKVRELHPELIVLYVSANKFKVQYTQSVINNTHNDFLNFYQMVDVLIVDDIQEMAGKTRTKTQNTFFHIFNHLHQLGKQLILSSDCPPSELKGVEERLLSRFKWGLVAEIEKPSKEVRLAILKQKSKRDGLIIDEELLNYLAENITSNVRELEGSLLALMAHSMHNNKKLDLALAKKIVGYSTKGGGETKTITVGRIQKLVCEFFNIVEEDILSKSRKREIAQARQIAMYLSKKMTKDSLVQIGNKLGNRDHSTVLYACNVVQDLIEVDKDFSKNIIELQTLLEAN